MKHSKETIIHAYNTCVLFETQKLHSSKDYLKLIQDLTGVKTTYCATCAAATKQVHNQFTVWLNRYIVDNFPELVVPLPTFETKYKSEHFQKNLQCISFEMLRNNVLNIRKDIAANKNNPSQYAALLHDYNAMQSYFKSKLSFKSMPEVSNETIISNETNEDCDPNETKVSNELQDFSAMQDGSFEKRAYSKRTIDLEVLKQMKSEGKTNVECAEHFGVSKQAIGKALK